MGKHIIRLVSFCTLVTFFACQLQPATAADPAGISVNTLSPSLLSGNNLNPERSEDGRNDIAGHLEPGAIGNGQPLVDLVAGKLPEPLTECKALLIDKIREAAELAMQKHIQNKKDIPAEHLDRAEEALNNLIDFHSNLTSKIHLYNAVISGPEDYLLGFNYAGRIGLSLELIENLSEEQLAQYIYHECVPEKDMITRDDHRTIYREMQVPVFGWEKVEALRVKLREYIDSAVTPKRDSSAEVVLKEDFKKGIGSLVEIDLASEYLDLFRFHYTGLYSEGCYIFTVVGLDKKFQQNVLFVAYNPKTNKWKMANVVKGLYDIDSDITKYAGFSDKNGVPVFMSPVGSEVKFFSVDLLGGEMGGRNLGVFKGHSEDVHSVSNTDLFDENGNVILVSSAKDHTVKFFSYNIQSDEILEIGEYKGEGSSSNETMLMDIKTQDGLDVFMAVGRNVHFWQYDFKSNNGKNLLKIEADEAIRGCESFSHLDSQENAIFVAYTSNKLIAFGVDSKVDAEKFRIEHLMSREYIQSVAPTGIVTAKGNPVILVTVESSTEDNGVVLLELDLEGGRMNEIWSFLKNASDSGTFEEIGYLNEDNILYTFSGGDVDNILFWDFSDAIVDNDSVSATGDAEREIGPGSETEGEDSPGVKGGKTQEPIFDMDYLSDINIERRALLFERNLVKLLSLHPDEEFVLAVDSEIGSSALSDAGQDAQVAHIYRAIDRLSKLRESDGTPVFPNLKVVRQKGSGCVLAGEVESILSEMADNGQKVGGVFMVVRNRNLEKGEFKSLENNANTWMSSIEDSSSTDIDAGDYLPVFEAAAMSIMAAMGADAASIKRLYDEVALDPSTKALITEAAINEMIKTGKIYILPKAAKIDIKELGKIYERVRDIYLSA